MRSVQLTLYASAMADAILAGKEYAQSQANAQAKGDEAAKKLLRLNAFDANCHFYNM